MNRFFQIGCAAWLASFLLLPGSLRAAEEQALALPVLQEGAGLPASRWDTEKLFDQVLTQLPGVLKELPQNIKRVTLLQLEGDPNYDLRPLRLRHRLLHALVANGRLEMVECRQCANLKIYVEQDSLILSRTVETNEQYKALGKELNIDSTLQGFLELDEKNGVLALNLKLVRTGDGSVVKTASLVAQSEASDQGLARPSDRESHIGFGLSPFLGFKYSGWVESNGTHSQEEVSSFSGLSLRLLTPTFWDSMDVGIDFDSFSATTTSATETLNISVVAVTPLVRYRAPFLIGGEPLVYVYGGFGPAMVEGNSQLGIKLGAEFFINQGLSIGLDIYSLGSADVDSYLSDATGTQRVNQFSGSATGISFRYLY
ncbi:MAG: hypothetical protein RRB13_01070 [bacterium]|nr:hypothetical protein [bacterium]